MTLDPALLQILKDETLDMNSLPNRGVCESCDRDEATVLCAQCHQIFCDDCQLIHKRARASFDHTFTTLEAYDPRREGRGCHLHPFAIPSAFCGDCNVSICSGCILSHQGHDCTPLAKAITLFKEKIISQIALVTLFFYYPSHQKRKIGKHINR